MLLNYTIACVSCFKIYDFCFLWIFINMYPGNCIFAGVTRDISDVICLANTHFRSILTQQIMYMKHLKKIIRKLLTFSAKFIHYALLTHCRKSIQNCIQKVQGPTSKTVNWSWAKRVCKDLFAFTQNGQKVLLNTMTLLPAIKSLTIFWTSALEPLEPIPKSLETNPKLYLIV